MKAVNIARILAAAGNEWKNLLPFSSRFPFLCTFFTNIELNEIAILTTAVCG
jgi:hypothetical protein